MLLCVQNSESTNPCSLLNTVRLIRTYFFAFLGNDTHGKSGFVGNMEQLKEFRTVFSENSVLLANTLPPLK